MKEKLRRQAVLLQLVNERSVASQEEMVQLLGELGYHTGQSSVSRDVRELGLVRVGGKYVPSDLIDSNHREVSGNELKNELITFSEPVGAHLVIVHTPPGAANTVAVDLDQRKLPDVAGTVAGDDTIFVAVRSRSAQGRILAMLRKSVRADQAPAVDLKGDQERLDSNSVSDRGNHENAHMD